MSSCPLCYAAVMGVKFRWVGRKNNHKMYITEIIAPNTVQETNILFNMAGTPFDRCIVCFFCGNNFHKKLLFFVSLFLFVFSMFLSARSGFLLGAGMVIILHIIWQDIQQVLIHCSVITVLFIS